MNSSLESVAEQSASPRATQSPRLYALLVTWRGYITAQTLPAYVASAIEPMRVTAGTTTWKLVVATNANVPRIEFVPRGVTRDPPEYVDAMTYNGLAFSLQLIRGDYYINGSGKMSDTAFCNALAQALAVPT